MTQKQFLIRFTGPEELKLYEFLRLESFETGLPMAEIMRQGLELYKKQKGENDMFKLDIYEVVTKEVDGVTVVDESAEWALVETIEGTSEEDCLNKANSKYDQENYHWSNPYKA